VTDNARRLLARDIRMFREVAELDVPVIKVAKQEGLSRMQVYRRVKAIQSLRDAKTLRPS